MIGGQGQAMMGIANDKGREESRCFKRRRHNGETEHMLKSWIPESEYSGTYGVWE